MKLLAIVAFCIYTSYIHTQTVVKSVSVGAAAGSSISPHGFLGVFVDLELAKNFELTAGLTLFPAKGTIGAKQHFPLGERFNICVLLHYVYLPSYNLMFEEESSNERFYKYSAAQFINSGVSLEFELPRKNTSNEKTIVFARAGYNHRISNWSVDPIDTSPILQSDIDKIYHRNFRNGVYWNVGVILKMPMNKKVNEQ